MPPVLQGELFKQGKDSWSAFNLRWVELHPDGTLYWYEKEGSQPSGSLNVQSHSVVLDSEITTNKDGEQRYGFRLVPATGRQYALQASSHEERHLWTMTMDQVAHPDAARHDAGMGRVLKVRRPAKPAKLGLDLGSSNGMPGVVVLRISGELASSGLFPGDCVLAVNNTVLRNSLVAARAFGREESELTLRLLGWNREARIVKHAGVAGLSACSPARGPGVLVSGLTRDGAAHEAGLHIGDRLLAVNGEALLDNDHEAVSKKILSATGDVRLTVSGSTTEVFVRKDTDGRLGLGFVTGGVPRLMQGAVVCEAVPRGEGTGTVAFPLRAVLPAAATPRGEKNPVCAPPPGFRKVLRCRYRVPTRP